MLDMRSAKVSAILLPLSVSMRKLDLEDSCDTERATYPCLIRELTDMDTVGCRRPRLSTS
jgi:hypothetical protein